MVPNCYPLMLGDVPFDTYLDLLKGLKQKTTKMPFFDVPVMVPGFPIKDTFITD